MGLRLLQRVDVLWTQLLRKTPECAVEELAQVREPGIFIVDDVAFIQGEHGMQIGDAIERRGFRNVTISRHGATCCCGTREYSN